MLARLFALLLTATASAAPHHTPPEQVVLAPGYSELAFTPPPPGSYQLAELGPAADGRVITDEGIERSLHDLMGDRFVLLSFIYTSCSDVNGCPLASYVMRRVQQRIRQDEALAGHVRLLSLSFDRQHDSPSVLADYARNFREPGDDWHFLTTPDDEALKHLLDSYNQFVIRDVDADGQVVGSISHILRVYLIDQNREIRNIYSVSFLHPDIIVNDIRTIVAGTAAGR